MLSLLFARAREQPDRIALVDHIESAGEGRPVTWDALARRVAAVAGVLERHGAPGDRVMICHGNDSHFIASLFGCFLAARIAVPFHTPRRGRARERFESILADCEPTLALTSAALLDKAREIGATPGLEWLASDTFEANVPRDVPPIDLGAVAYLQYTSGSTASPRGVRISHANLFANVRDIARAVPPDAGSLMLSWLPLYHDMGLVFGAMFPLHAGVPAHIMEPAAFMQEPMRWPRMIARLRATHSAAPTFAYRLAAERAERDGVAGLDLSSWTCAMCGAEPIHQATLERFAAVFAPAGFNRDALSVGYGLAEATLMVTAATGGIVMLNRQGASREADAPQVSVGEPPEGTLVRIVNPDTGRPCPAGETGEVWVSGPAVATGCWNRERPGEDGFGARLKGEKGLFLRTGDLGFVDGRALAVTGRIKDLVIVRGANHHPHDIERIAESAHPDLRPNAGAAFSVALAGEEELVVLQEVRRTALRRLDREAVMRAIRVAVTEASGISPGTILLLRPGSVPMTPSGKPQRRLAARHFTDGAFEPVARWQAAPATAEEPPPSGDAADLVGWLRERCGRVLGVAASAIDTREPFERFGFDSLAATTLAREIEMRLGRPVPPTIAYDYPSIDALARFLAGESAVDAPMVSDRKDEPIAIVGMAVRLPGAPDLEAFGELLYSDRDSLGELPEGRWRAEAERLRAGLEEPARSVPVTRGGWLDDVAGFDEGFFGMSPREAAFVDPQQRLLVEVAWEALEDAGIPADGLTGRDVGVCVGISDCDYRRRAGPASAIDPYLGTGSALSMAANRLSYLLDLKGPSLAIDTACSSSLVAVHEAAAMLRDGRTELALAGGVNLILGPETSIVFARNGMLARDGTCKTFDSRADGYVRGEGCAVVVLKRLSDAVRDGDRIRAVLHGSAVNQDGRSNGLTAPSGRAQQAVIRLALAASGRVGREIGYVEAHGTGTALGDPIEFAALDAVYGALEDDVPPCHLGALKTVIGHLEAAAGIAGLIKTVLILERGEIPSNRHYFAPNAQLGLAGSRLRVAAATARWDGGSRFAGVSAFGFGGTNAHVVLGAAPTRPEMSASLEGREAPGLLVFSARSRGALKDLARGHAGRVEALDGRGFAGYARAAVLGRAALPIRAAVAAANGAEAARRLRAWLAGEAQSGVHVDEPSLSGGLPPRIGLLFTGEYALPAGTGAELLRGEPVFRAAYLRAAKASLREGVNLVEALGSDAMLARAPVAQPVQFALAHALGELWRSWGVEPHALLGHGLGEYAAACFAGTIEVEDAVRAVIARARLAEDHGPAGAMLAIDADAGDIPDLLGDLAVSLAVDDGPGRVIVAGDSEVIGAARDRLASREIKCVDLDIARAFHRPAMQRVADEMAAYLTTVPLAAPRLPVISSMTGEQVAAELATPAYWAEQIVRPVAFAKALRSMVEAGCDHFLEIGGAPLLTPIGSSLYVDRPDLHWTASLRPGEPERAVLAEAAGALFCSGVRIQWPRFFDGAPDCTRSLPTYPFQRRRHWLPDELADAHTAPLQASGFARIDTASAREAVFAGRLDPHEDARLGDHRVGGRLWTPAATMLALAVRAVRETSASGSAVALEAVRFLAPLEISETQGREIRVVAGLEQPAELFLSARAGDGGWSRHVRAVIAGGSASVARPEFETVRAACDRPIAVAALYERLAAAGLDYGPSLRRLAELRCGDDQLLARTEPGAAGLGECFDPAVLDACFQSLAALIPGDAGTAWVPAAIDRIGVFDVPDGPLWCHATLRRSEGPGAVFDLSVFAEGAAQAAIRIERMLVSPVPAADAGPAIDPQRSLHRLRWVPVPLETDSRPTSATVAKAAREELAKPALRARLAAWEAESARVERACGHVAARALADLAGQAVLAEPEELGARTGVLPRYHLLLPRLYALADEAGLLVRDGTRWRLGPDLPDVVAALACSAGDGPEARLLRRCAPAIADVLRGARDPLDLLFGEDGGASALYHDSVGLGVVNAIAARAVRAACGAAPGRGAPAVLEIGGGTGATTAAILATLADLPREYCFTDRAPAFLAAARDRFGEHPGFTVAALDIERDPGVQGFTPGRYDVVVAANVLHATQDLAATLSHLRALMAPGGTLVLVEGTRRLAFSDLTFGLTEGWWRFTDHLLRPDHPLLDGEGWSGLLNRCGFAEIEVLSPADGAGTPLGQSLIVATAARELAASARRWLFLADTQGTGAALARALAAHGHVALVGEAECGDGLTAAIQAAATVVDLRALDMPSTEGRAQDVHLSCLAAVTNLAALVKACTAAAHRTRLVVVTRGAEGAPDHGGMPGVAQSVVRGVGRTIALEHPELACLRVDLDPLAPDDVTLLAAELLADDRAEDEIAFRHGRRLAARIAPLDPVCPVASEAGANRQRLVARTPGDLSSLIFVADGRREPAAGEILVAVEVSALHFRDLLTALHRAGCESDAFALGTECVGIVEIIGAGVGNIAVGDRVLALADGACSSHVIVRADRAVRCPPGMDPEAAADCGAYVTALRAFACAPEITPGDRVLIHAAAGATGLAALGVARARGARVMASASPWKWPALRRRGVETLFHSRHADFAAGARAASGGKGVSVVLNSLTGEAIAQGFAALARGGTFVELGRETLLSDDEARRLRTDVRYRTVNLVEDLSNRTQVVRGLMAEAISGLADGRWPALPRRLFPRDHAGEAFRHMQAAGHVGRILLDHRRSAADGIRLRDNAIYLVTGGLGGIGLALAHWLIERGARSIVLAGRGAPGEEAEYALAAWRAAAIDVSAVRLDVADGEALQRLLGEIAARALPLRGVFHAAGVLEDATLLNLDADRASRVLRPKIAGAMELHSRTSDLPLDYFVLFSSAVGLLGMPGQAAHAAANAFLDALAHHRTACGLPAHSIQWGPWGEIGAAAGKVRGGSEHLPGIAAMPPADALAALDTLLDRPLPVSAAIAADWEALVRAVGPRALLRDAVDMARIGASRTAAQRAPDPLQLRQAAPDEARMLIGDWLAALVARTLDAPDPSEVRRDQGFFDMGMDSLTSLELRNALQRAFDRPIPSMLTFDHPTLDALTDWLLAEVTGSGTAEMRPAVASDEGDEIDRLQQELARELESLSLENLA